MKVAIKRYVEENIEVETGVTRLSSAVLFREALLFSAELADETIPTNPPVIKQSMPRIVIAYLFDEIAEAPFLKGADFAEKCRLEGMLSFEKPPADSRIASVKFKNGAPKQKVLQKMNASLLELGEVISEEIDKGLVDIFENMGIDSEILEQMPPIHWVVCDEFPECGSELFPDED